MAEYARQKRQAAEDAAFAKEVNNKSKVGQERNQFVIKSLKHIVGPVLFALASPTPKRFIAPNSSKTSAVLSEALSKLLPQKINIGGVRRLYTHTVNGTARYAATWGRYLGRWGTRIAGPAGVVITAVDFTNEVAIPMSAGLKDYNNKYKDAGVVYHICFAKGTLVSSKAGFVEIQTIQIGDSVYTYNEKKRLLQLCRVKNVIAKNADGIYELSTQNQKIYVTSEHPFYVIGKGWTTVKNLKLNDKFKTDNPTQYEELKSLRYMKQRLMVYNIEVAGNHNYFVTSRRILVHNKKIPSYIIENKRKARKSIRLK